MHSPRLLLAVVASAVIMMGPTRAADLPVPAQYPTIADAFAATSPGDRVVLAAGVYHEHDLDLPAGITLLGNPSAPASVVIDAGGRGRVIRAESLDHPAVISGVTLTRGRAEGSNPYDASGAGLLVSRSSVRLEDTRLADNSAAASGGGLRVSHGTLVMVRCEVRGNAAGKGGGGLDLSYESTVNALETEFVDNVSGWGGGMSVRSSSRAAIFESRFQANRALGSPGLGGAVACDGSAEPAFQRCVMVDNEATYGGAIFSASGARPTLSHVTIDRNTVSGSGGGLYCQGSDVVMATSIVSFNSDVAITCLDEAHLELTGCDIFGNEDGDWTDDLDGQGNQGGNFSADPLYCAPGDRHLRDDSPCAPDRRAVGLVGALGIDCTDAVAAPDAPRVAELRAQPNPFNPRTEVVYVLPDDGRARVSVFDLRGRRLTVLVDEVRPAGEHRVRWGARDDAGHALASGTYLLVLETGGQRLTSKLMLLR